jgi:hypothetical protein
MDTYSHICAKKARDCGHAANSAVKNVMCDVTITSHLTFCPYCCIANGHTVALSHWKFSVRPLLYILLSNTIL